MKFIPNLSLVTLGSGIRAGTGTTAFKASFNCVTILILLSVNFALVQCDCEWSETETTEEALQHFPLSILNSNETTNECSSTRISVKIRNCPPNQNTSESESTKYSSFSKNYLNTTSWQLISLNCSSSQPVTWNIHGNLKSELIQSVAPERKYVGQNNSFVYSVTVNITVQVGDVGFSDYTLTCEHPDNTCPSQKSFYFYGKQTKTDLRDNQLSSLGFASGVPGNGTVPARSNELEIKLEFSNNTDFDYDSKSQSFVCTHSSRSNSSELGSNPHSEKSSEPVSVSMAAIKCTSPIHCKLVTRFLDTTSEIDGNFLLNEANFLIIPQSFTGGVVLCRTNDKMKYQYVQFYRSVDDQSKILLYDDGQNQDYENYLQSSEIMKMDVSSIRDFSSSSVHYTGIHISCKFSNFLIAKGSNYILKNSNGTILTHPLVETKGTCWTNWTTYMDSKLVSSVSDCPKDVASIICRAPLWNSDEWVNLTYSVSSPKILHDSRDIWYLYDTNTDADITLSCQAVGLPRPYIYWYKDGQIVPDGHGDRNYSQTSNSTISSLRFSFNRTSMSFSAFVGKYSCNATNYFGEDSMKFTIIVISSWESQLMYSLIAVGILSISVIAALLLWLYMYKKSIKALKDDFIELGKDYYDGFKRHFADDDGDNRTRLITSVRTNVGFVCALQKHYNQSKLTIKEKHLTKYDETPIKSGNFGKIYRAKLVKGSWSKKVTEVVVKESINRKPGDAIDLLAEFKTLLYVGEQEHPNIVRLLGAVVNFRKRNFQIVLEWCENGSLKDFIDENRNNYSESRRDFVSPPDSVYFHDNSYTNSIEDSDARNIITREDLIRWSCELACGMEHLASLQLVHADLAIRNLLLTKERVLKITDFGFSKMLRQYDEFYTPGPNSTHHEKQFPWRALAVECTNATKLSTKSDVWAYGVTLWEIFSLGKIPYGTTSAAALEKALQRGVRLIRPTHATNRIYKVMEQCWSHDPHGRPEFSSLVTTFKDILRDETNEEGKPTKASQQQEPVGPSPEQDTINYVKVGILNDDSDDNVSVDRVSPKETYDLSHYVI